MSDQKQVRVSVSLPDGAPLAEWTTREDGTHDATPPTEQAARPEVPDAWLVERDSEHERPEVFRTHSEAITNAIVGQNRTRVVPLYRRPTEPQEAPSDG